jgi:DNA-binding phage protein
MKSIEIQISDSWLDSLIESLKNPEEAAEYLSVILEDEPEKDQILRYALKDVVEAHRQRGTFSDEGKKHYENLERIFSDNEGAEIYTLIKLLDALGFKLVVTIK